MEKNKLNLDLDTVIKFSPVIVVIFCFFMSYKVFVTPVDLERRLQKYDEHIEKMYATKTEVEQQEKQLNTISVKIDKIYDYIIGKK